MARTSLARIDVLRLLASRLGFAIRHSRKSLGSNDSVRFLDPLRDVLDDIGEAIRFEGLSVANAPPAIQAQLPLLASLASISTMLTSPPTLSLSSSTACLASSPSSALGTSATTTVTQPPSSDSPCSSAPASSGDCDDHSEFMTKTDRLLTGMSLILDRELVPEVKHTVHPNLIDVPVITDVLSREAVLYDIGDDRLDAATLTDPVATTTLRDVEVQTFSPQCSVVNGNCVFYGVGEHSSHVPHEVPVVLASGVVSCLSPASLAGALAPPFAPRCQVC
mmetsp:Transcript_42612/g.110267  ORF Transcript_42612/g.110267 Transcript_42612/m.110267 type:complete len:278 (-) Transcript_42612:264-1097(-)